MQQPLPPPTARARAASLRRHAWRIGGLALLAAGGLWAGLRTAQAATEATLVEAVQLPAWVERHGARRPAQPGQLLRHGDQAFTAGGARLLLRLADRSTIRLGEHSQLRIDQMETRRQGAARPSDMRAGLHLVTGVFRYATDYSSKALGNQRQLNLKLATATVGIRGTDFWSMTDAEHDAVCVFDGRVAVQRDNQPEIPLDKPGAFWVVFTGQPEKPAGQATPEQLAKFIDQAEMKPGSGILLQGGRWRAVAGLTPSAGAAQALKNRLHEAGFPADVVVKEGRHEVRISQFATEADAQTVLARLQASGGLHGSGARVALAAE